MEKMKSLETMKPLEPMKPFDAIAGESWWPTELGNPTSSGSTHGVRYAYFSHARRLVIERDGRRTTYDTGTHRFEGVVQASDSGNHTLSFQSERGPIDLQSLSTV